MENKIPLETQFFNFQGLLIGMVSAKVATFDEVVNLYAEKFYNNSDKKITFPEFLDNLKEYKKHLFATI